jgi:D-glycero-beta-D-manno-heptose-7-phosphate kinase
MVKFTSIFSQFGPFKTLVLGDFLLDTYTTGRVKRISPEAPVPVMEVQRCESLPGGAGNVVLNLISLGGSVIAAGRIGDDREGRELKERLELADTSTLLTEPHYKTPVKNRILAEGQHLLRVDFETLSPLNPSLEEEMIGHLKKVIPQVQVVALSDYGKGFLTPRLIAATIEVAKQHKIPVVVDPKGTDFSKYRGATLIKPNLSEAYAAAKLPHTAPLEQVARQILDTTAVDLLLITRSEAGISIFDARNDQCFRTDFPVKSKEVKDVTGAGDTVLAMICSGLANGRSIETTAQLANIAASISIERLGCAQVSIQDLARRVLENDCHSKVFDESHIYALHQVLQGKRYSLLVLEKGQEMTNSLFRTLKNLAEKEDEELIIYVRDTRPSDEFIHLLSSLKEVDYIILQTEGLKSLCEAIHPHEIYLLQKGQIVRLEPAKELLNSLIEVTA